VIEAVELREPQVRLISRGDGSLHGFSGLVKRSSGSVQDDGGSTRPSDVFAIRRIGVAAGCIQYEGGGGPPMRLDDLDLDLTAEPGGAEPGWYALAAHMVRPPVLEMSMGARLNIDTALLAIDAATVDMSVDPSQRELLPPWLQSLLRQHRVAGRLTGAVRGEVPLGDAASGSLDVELQLADANVRLGEIDVPVESLLVRSRLAERRLLLESVDARLLGGAVALAGEIELDGQRAAWLDVEARGLRLEHLTSPDAARQPRYAGSADLRGEMSVSLAAAPDTLDGSGRVEITDGTLVDDPLLGGVYRAIGFGVGSAGRDRGSADLHLEPRRFRFTDIELVAPTFAARGAGEIGFDSSIAFTINAGHMERLQAAIGPLGEAIGKLTDKAVVYEVSGTLAEPRVNVRAFGMGR
jgi:hypothetical protein